MNKSQGVPKAIETSKYQRDYVDHAVMSKQSQNIMMLWKRSIETGLRITRTSLSLIVKKTGPYLYIRDETKMMYDTHDSKTTPSGIAMNFFRAVSHSQQGLLGQHRTECLLPSILSLLWPCCDCILQPPGCFTKELSGWGHMIMSLRLLGLIHHN